MKNTRYEKPEMVHFGSWEKRTMAPAQRISFGTPPKKIGREACECQPNT